jgi:hypothetical protein
MVDRSSQITVNLKVLVALAKIAQKNINKFKIAFCMLLVAELSFIINVREVS